MKKIIRTIATVTALFAAATVVANEPKLETDGISKSVIFSWDAGQEMTSLKFLDEAGHIIYSDFVEQSDSYIKRFNLESLAEGDYSLEVENTLKEIVYFIRVNKNGIVILNRNEDFKPSYKNEGRVVYLNLLNLEKEEVKVTILDSLGRTLFKETFDNKTIVEKVFNFENAVEGEYTILVKKDRETYYETISI